MLMQVPRYHELIAKTEEAKVLTVFYVKFTIMISMILCCIAINKNQSYIIITLDVSLVPRPHRP